MNNPNQAANSEDFEFAALSEAENYRQAIVTEFAPYLRRRVLEIGAGIGQISAELLRLPEVNELVGIEPDPRFHPGFRERLPQTRLVEGTTADLDGNDSYDAAVMVNVLEHIEHDTEELERIRSILQPRSGMLCILVPARQEIYSRLDAHFGHFRRYSRTTLKAKLETAGFRVHRIHYFNFIGYFAWMISFRLLGRMSFDIGQVRMFDRRILPVGHWFESKLVRPPLGQSVIAIAEAT